MPSRAPCLVGVTPGTRFLIKTERKERVFRVATEWLLFAARGRTPPHDAEVTEPPSDCGTAGKGGAFPPVFPSETTAGFGVFRGRRLGFVHS